MHAFHFDFAAFHVAPENTPRERTGAGCSLAGFERVVFVAGDNHVSAVVETG